MVDQEPVAVVDALEDAAKKICEYDARLQFVVKQSFYFTRFQSRLAERFKLKIQHHVHDCVLYHLLIEDIYVCVFGLLGITQKFCGGVADVWPVLLYEIYTIYAPFIDFYAPDCNAGVSWVFNILEEARGMHLNLFHSFIS